MDITDPLTHTHLVYDDVFIDNLRELFDKWDSEEMLTKGINENKHIQKSEILHPF